MSKSTRKPYGTAVRVRSSQKDRKFANRAYHQVAKRYLNNAFDFEEILVPHPRECSNNDPWGWDCDGTKDLQPLKARHWSRHCLIQQGFGSRWDRAQEWPPQWYIKSLRK